MTRMLTVTHRPGLLPDISKILASLNMGARLVRDKAASMADETPKIPWKKLCVAGILAAFSEVFHLVETWQAKPFRDRRGLSHSTGLFPDGRAGTRLLGHCHSPGRPFDLQEGLACSLQPEPQHERPHGCCRDRRCPHRPVPPSCHGHGPLQPLRGHEAKSLDRARNAIRELLALAPERATVRQADGSWLAMDIREVAVGSIVRVRPGEKVALDGVVTSGHSTVNQAPITGESMPVEKSEGSQVYAGTINEAGSFEFEVTALATNSTLARIIHAVEEAQATRAPMQRFVDAFARYYTPAVFLVAIAVAVLMPLFTATPVSSAVYTALVVLVIGCPCALVISTPVSIVSGMAAATRSGILVKGGMFLEQGRLLKAIAFDKTGTITRGPAGTDGSCSHGRP